MPLATYTYPQPYVPSRLYSRYLAKRILSSLNSEVRLPRKGYEAVVVASSVQVTVICEPSGKFRFIERLMPVIH